MGTVAQDSRYIGPSLSPDGTRLAVTIFVGNQGIADNWVSTWRVQPALA